MKNFTLTYFDINAGRAEAARLAFILGKIPFNDVRVNHQQFAELRDSLPLGQLPVLDVDGTRYTQSNTILRLVGRLANLYPDDAEEAARCDEILDIIEDIAAKFSATIMMQNAEKKLAREHIYKTDLPKALSLLNRYLTERGGHFCSSKLSISELRAFVLTNELTSGILEYIPATVAQEYAPRLIQLQQELLGISEIARHYSQ